MSTSWQIGYIDNQGNIRSVPVNYNGNPEYVREALKALNITKVDRLKAIIKFASSNGIQDIDISERGHCKISYYRMRSQTRFNCMISFRVLGRVSQQDFLKKARYDSGADFVYLYSERDQTWYWGDIEKHSALRKFDLEGLSRKTEILDI